MNKIVEYFKNNKLALKSKVCHDFDRTPYIYCIGDIIYKFSSAKKREIFLRQCEERKHKIRELFLKLSDLCVKELDFDIDALLKDVPNVVYSEMLHR